MSINKYKKKPIIIEAVQWTGINLEEIESFVGDSLDYNYKTHWDSSDLSNIEVKIKTLEGDHIVSIGDYIIKGVNGEFYPCKPDIFKKTYESVALTPLYPVSREQVEKVWRGYWIHDETASDKSIDGKFFLPLCNCSRCGGYVQREASFCPLCGAPMTDEAVEMVMERMKTLYD